MQISILGCGWLGLPLAERFIKEGFTVKGSVTSPEKTEILRAKGIVSFVINLNEIDEVAVAEFLRGSDVLIIAIPPKVKDNTGLSYPEKIEILLPFIAKAAIRNVLFTSSTSVYADVPEIPVITESTPPNPDSESGRQVLAAEQVLQASEDFKTTILRLGGLIGGERHPVYHLAGKTNLQNPNAPVNLANRDMIIEAVLQIITNGIFGKIYLIVNPEHPTRKDFYTAEAQRLGLPLPEFSESGNNIGKYVRGSEI